MLMAVQMLFQFSPSREGGRLRMQKLTKLLTFQFSPSREGGRPSNVSMAQRTNISILALAGGRSRARKQAAQAGQHFNSRPRGRAVLYTIPVFETKYNFNSRPRGRAVGGRSAGMVSVAQFQFSPSREGGLQGKRPHRSRFHFNSRPRGRAVIAFGFMMAVSYISILALAGGRSYCSI